MAKVNQLTPEQKAEKSEHRKLTVKKNQRKADNNLKFYKQVEDERYNIHQYGPIIFYFPETKETFETIKDLDEFKKLYEYQKRCAGVKNDIKIQHVQQVRRMDGGGTYKIENIRIFCKQCGPKFIMKYVSGMRTNYEWRLVYFDNSHHH